MRAPRLLLALTTALFLAAGISAQQMPPQQQSPTKGLVKKGKVPVSSEIITVKLPKPAEADLANGLHLMVLEDHRLPQVSFTIYIPGAGGYYDPADHPGLASFTAALMREGTATRTSEKISQELEVMAASLNAAASVSGQEATVSGSSLSNQLDHLFDLTADVLLHPSFPDEELTRYKQRTRQFLTQTRAQPGFLAQEMFQRVVYGSHPASRVLATIPALDKTTRDALIECHRTHFVPDHAGMAISGDISMADAKKAGLATKATIIVFVRSQARSDGGTELWVDHVAYGGVWSSLDLDVLYARSMAVVLDCVNEKGRKIMESAGRA